MTFAITCSDPVVLWVCIGREWRGERFVSLHQSFNFDAKLNSSDWEEDSARPRLSLFLMRDWLSTERERERRIVALALLLYLLEPKKQRPELEMDIVLCWTLDLLAPYNIAVITSGLWISAWIASLEGLYRASKNMSSIRWLKCTCMWGKVRDYPFLGVEIEQEMVGDRSA